MIEFILYVSDQNRSKAFYTNVLQKTPSLDVSGMTEFDLSETCKLGLMPENGIAKILGERLPHPASGNGIPRCELYLFQENAAEVCERAARNGGKMISAMQPRDWGHTVGYVADPDGHVLAFAEKI
ncbi:VOC family protein [Adhaeribacter sp. BT258]|uniref:VOC family protein n=1 Tax=Adhaeribacter terrigena TaxID=2793070 RepID=A0ABS1BYX5_9BACT|nr:VOC family protein [Adhaeribacter terrigena]MBK0402364.1 VOC family protein [Adhaeribacter terrigena]